jgi:hypothetical protein
MNKIIISALASAKPTVEQLLEVIAATPNIEVATEILLGVYEQPFMEAECKRKSDTEVNVQYISYDRFNQTVEYSYNRVECINRYIPNDKEVKLENAIGSYAWGDDAANYLKMDRKEFDSTHTRHSFKSEPSEKLYLSTMPLDSWNGFDNQKKR